MTLSTLFHSIGSFAVPVAIKGTMVLGVALLFTRFARRAAARHQILSCAMLGLIALPILALVLPSYSLNIFPSGTAEIDPEFGAVGDVAASSSATKVNSTSTNATPSSHATEGTAQGFGATRLFGLLFLLGFAALIIRMGRGFLAARRLLRASQPLSDSPWYADLSVAAQQLEIRDSVQLAECSEISVPMTLGVVRPHILIPQSARDWPAPRRQLVLLHELAHIKRRDVLISALSQLACALHFFNPLIWLAERRLQRERELAADDLVIGVGVRPSSYASELLDVARGLREGAPRTAFSVAMAARSQLEGRLRRILDPRADHRPLTISGSATMILLSIGLLLPLSALRGFAAPAVATVAGNQAVEKLRTQITAELAKSLGKRPTRVETTLDPLAQSLVEQELDAITQRFAAKQTSIVIMAPQRGAILGMGSRGGGARNLSIDEAYEPASTIKVFTVATAIEAGSITPDQRFATASDKSGVHDVSPSSELSVADILVRSSNIGTLKIYRTIGKERLLRGFQRFHFGEAPPVELGGVAAGSAINMEWSDSRAEAASFGHQLTASPLQIAAAFCAVANHGIYHAPTLVEKALGPGGETLRERSARPEQVVKPETADAVLRMLEGVVQRDDGTGTGARVAGYRVAGKTGSGEKSGYFVGAVPADKPRYVILVAVESPQNIERAFGNVVAAPSFRRIAETLLATPAR